MSTYHKIITVWERDPSTNHKTLIEDKFATPELKFLAKNRWVFTEKVDGTNIRIIWDGVRVTLGGKTDRAQLFAPLVAVLQERFHQDNMLRVFPPVDYNNVILYGEGYGAKIQKGGGNYISDRVDFVLFDVRIGNIWLSRDNVEDIADKLNIPVVPRIGSGNLFESIEITRAGFSSIWGDFIAEGMVMRPETELLDRRGQRIITKIKFKDFR